MTTKTHSTDQEAFWAGQFGTDYIDRNRGEMLLAANLDFFAKALGKAQAMTNCIEFGANIGMNLRALRLLYPEMTQAAIEINAEAAGQLRQILPAEHIHNISILDFESDGTWDLVLIKGVLIHTNPDVLPVVYSKLAKASARYLLIAEYYNPSPVTISYRGHSDRLFKRDFAGEMMEHHPEFKLVDYGFAYRRDPKHPQDDITWFLMEKR